MIRILIVDDHPVVRDGIKTMLTAVKGYKVEGCATCGNEALHFAKTVSAPDVLLSDVRLGDMDGISMFSRMRLFAPRTRAIFIAGMPNATDEARAKKCGASAYLPKSVEMDDLIATIRTAANGDGEFISFAKHASVASPLTFRETQILTLLANGDSKALVGEKVGISFETVKTYVRSIREKLGASNTTAACSIALANGYISI